jgi:cell division topological specificity factor
MSSIFQLFRRRPTATVARERLQILLAHERASVGHEGLVATLREEILAVIAKHIPVARDQVRVNLGNDGDTATLEIEVEMPAGAEPRIALRA